MSTFQILPAIDLLDGTVVRLAVGDFGRRTTYTGDPVDIARDFAAAGAAWIHVVDLDAARDGKPRQLATVERIAAAIRGACRVELGGGIRDLETALAARDAGAQRLVLGTAAVRAPELVEVIVDAAHVDVAVALDIRGGRAVGEGWRQDAAGIDADRALERLRGLRVAAFEVTSIERDGLLGGPDLELLSRLAGLAPGRIVASGGIRSISDLEELRGVGCSGAIVGRAIYEGGIDLAAAIEHLS